MGQRVSYTEISNDKGVCAGNIKLIKGVCVCVRSCVFKKERTGIETIRKLREREGAHTHLGARSWYGKASNYRFSKIKTELHVLSFPALGGSRVGN